MYTICFFEWIQHIKYYVKDVAAYENTQKIHFHSINDEMISCLILVASSLMSSEKHFTYLFLSS